jgi:hypothetical protein
MPLPLPPFSHDPTLLEQISVIRTQSSEHKRAPDSDERELFTLVKDLLPAAEASTPNAESPHDGVTQATTPDGSPEKQQSATEAQATDPHPAEASPNESAETPPQQ